MKRKNLKINEFLNKTRKEHLEKKQGKEKV